MPLVHELDAAYAAVKVDPAFQAELGGFLTHYVGRPSPLYFAERHKPNVFRMNLLGAEVRPVTSGSATLKDAMNEALRDWVTNVHDTYYLIGTAAGMHPYPVMVRDFQAVIGQEVREQILQLEG